MTLHCNASADMTVSYYDIKLFHHIVSMLNTSCEIQISYIDIIMLFEEIIIPCTEIEMSLS